MALDDYIEPEVAIAVAVTAAVASPPVRKLIRQGAVYGLAGLMLAGDRISSLSRSLGSAAQQLVPASGKLAEPEAQAASEAAH